MGLLWAGTALGSSPSPLPAAATLPSRDEVKVLQTVSPTPLADPFQGEGLEGELGPQSVNFSWLFLKTILVMVLVIALAIIVLRFIIPKLSLRGTRSSSDIQVVERVPLDHKKILYVLEVEGRRLLLSATDHSVNLITELSSDHESTSN